MAGSEEPAYWVTPTIWLAAVAAAPGSLMDRGSSSPDAGGPLPGSGLACYVIHGPTAPAIRRIWNLRTTYRGAASPPLRIV